MDRKTILIVDDDAGIRKMLSHALSGTYSVNEAAQGREALDVIGRLRPDLLLLDLAMPIMDGMSLLKALHDAWGPASPSVVVMTAHGSAKAAVQAVRLGASDFLEKPFTPQDVRQSVASVLWQEEEDEKSQLDSVLDRVREALRRGKFISAEAALTQAGAISETDAGYQNLLGVMHEAHGRTDKGRLCYQKALAFDPACIPALNNLKRLDELAHRGASGLEVSLGDELIAH
jgi:DNA-binding NtrC family response regulator